MTASEIYTEKEKGRYARRLAKAVRMIERASVDMSIVELGHIAARVRAIGAERFGVDRMDQAVESRRSDR